MKVPNTQTEFRLNEWRINRIIQVRRDRKLIKNERKLKKINKLKKSDRNLKSERKKKQKETDWIIFHNG